MGYDITYHPFHESEIKDVYFAGVRNPSIVNALANKYSIPEDQLDDLQFVFERAKEFDTKDFGRSHGFNLAVTAGFLRPYWYLRQHALSFMRIFNISDYLCDWKSLVPEKYKKLQFPILLGGNFRVGIFLPSAKLKKLRLECLSNANFQKTIRKQFDGESYDVFMNAVNYANKHDLGLLEASDVMMGNAINPKASFFHSSPENCMQDGIKMFVNEMREYTRKIEEQRTSNKPGEVRREEDKKSKMMGRMLETLFNSIKK